MRLFIAADHRGFELKDKLIDYLHEKEHRIEDLGAYELNPTDDYPDFAKKVAQAVLQDPQNSLGILICGGGGVEITANRYKGIRCALGFNENQVKHVRENDHANILSLPSDYIDFETACRFTDIFLNTEVKQDEKYLRRVKKNDEIGV